MQQNQSFQTQKSKITKTLSKPSTTKMKKNQSLLFFSLSLTVLSLFYSTPTLAAISPAIPPTKPTPASASPAAAPPGLVPVLPQTPDATPDTSSADIVGILRKAKGFNVFIRLMKVTQLINQLNSQLITTKSGGITIFAPDDSAFSELKAGFLNTLSDGQKLALLQFHVLPDYVSSSNFDTLTNPVRTLAGANPARFQLNVISYGGNVNISTGVVNTTVTGIVYTDKHLAIYKVGKVLLPQDFFASKITPSSAPALSPESTAKSPKADKDKSSSPSESSDDSSSSQEVSTEGSGTVTISVHGIWVSLGVAFMALLTF